METDGQSQSMVNRLDGYFLGVSGLRLFWVSLFGVLIVGTFDHWTGPEISFSLFYLVPIALSAWYGPAGQGPILCLMSAGIWMAADISAGHFHSHLLIPAWNALVRLGFFLIITGLLRRLRGTLYREQRLAHTDVLTGLANNRAFYEQVDRESERSRRYRHPMSIAYFDLDNFKTVNDQHGHDTGDAVLRTVAQVLREHVRKTDVVARLGGDEFAGLFPETDYEAARALIQKIHPHLLHAMNRHQWPVTFSIGTLVFAHPLESNREMIKAADDLMYQVKKSGKNNLLVRQYDGQSMDSVPGTDRA